MTVKLAVLKTGENIISEIKEGFYMDKLVCYILENPCKVTINGSYKILDQDDGENQYSVSLQRWPVLSKNTTVELEPNSIVTLVDPIDKLEELYQTEVIGKNENNQINSVDEQSDLGLTD